MKQSVYFTYTSMSQLVMDEVKAGTQESRNQEARADAEGTEECVSLAPYSLLILLSYMTQDQKLTSDIP